MQFSIVPQDFPFVKRIFLIFDLFLQYFLFLRIKHRKKAVFPCFYIIYSKKTAEAKKAKCLGKKIFLKYIKAIYFLKFHKYASKHYRRRKNTFLFSFFHIPTCR